MRPCTPRTGLPLSALIPPHQVTFATLFTDGRQWGGVFFAEIQSSCTKVQARKGGLLQLVLPKKVPLLTWPSLLVCSSCVYGSWGYPMYSTGPNCYLFGRRNLWEPKSWCQVCSARRTGKSCLPLPWSQALSPAELNRKPETRSGPRAVVR